MNENIVVETTTPDRSVVPLGDVTRPANTIGRAAEATTQKNTATHDVFQNEHMYIAEYIAWSITDPVGTILRIMKNHPDNHVFTKILAPHHLYWAGCFRDHLLMCGTALYGGKIRACKVPPQIPDEAIRQMSIHDLSRFPGVDMDPKQFTEASLEYDDINRMAFHTYSPDQSDPDNIGGKIVVFVLGKLQATLQDAEPVTIIVQRSLNHSMNLYHFVPAVSVNPSIDTVFGPFGIGTNGEYIFSLVVSAQSTRVFKKEGIMWETKNNRYTMYEPHGFTFTIDKGVPASQEVAGFTCKVADVKATITAVDTVKHRSRYLVVVESTGMSNHFDTTDSIVCTIDKTKKEILDLTPIMPSHHGAADIRPVNSERILIQRTSYGDNIVYPGKMVQWFNDNFPPLATQEVLMCELIDTTGRLIMYCKLHPEGYITLPAGADGAGELLLPTELRMRYFQITNESANFPASASNLPLLQLSEEMYLEKKAKMRAMRAVVGTK